MNQKLRTVRSGIVILFAVLCIVCLSLSLAFSAHFAAYAEDEAAATLPDKDVSGKDLWLIHYEGQEAGESLWDGKHNGEPIAYIDSISDGICYGNEEEVNYFTPYRGKELTLKLNPDYEVEGGKLSDLYNLTDAVYSGNSSVGDANSSVAMTTTVTAQPVEGGAAEQLELTKDWKIATLCNLIDVEGTFISNCGYADTVKRELLKPVLGDTVVYDISSSTGVSIIIAVKYGVGGDIQYLNAGKDGDNYLVSDVAWDSLETEAAAKEGYNLIDYKIRRLDALTADTESGLGAYTLTVAAMNAEDDDGILYTQSNVSCDFNISRQSLGTDGESDTTFNQFFDYSIENLAVEYSGGSEWLQQIGFKLWLNGIEMQEGKDFTLTSVSSDVGGADFDIVGIGSLEGKHTIGNRVRITPARNEWATMPNIIPWTYGTYKADNNLIVGLPKFLDDPQDIKFRIVSLITNANGDVTEKVIEGLTDIHYYVDPESNEINGIVTDDVIKALAALDVGSYRLYASVYGVSSAEPAARRNYQAISEVSVDFKIFEGVNHWKAGSEPAISGWTTGKLDSTDGLMNAESVFGTPILMIRDMDDNIIYSNLPRHANTEVGDINVLKGLKAGRYYLYAKVEGTNNYAELVSTVIFDVAPNNLPIWAVILIVAGSLGIVAVVFIILHQKGVLQMLTGKVIVSMRTRANVDATLAAIRAAKVAREAEASIAAAKAREAEEAANADKSEKK